MGRQCRQCLDPHVAGLLCKNCNLCAGCLPDDTYAKQANRNAPMAPPQRQNGMQNSQQGLKAKPLHAELREFLERNDGKKPEVPPTPEQTWPKATPTDVAKRSANVEQFCGLFGRSCY